ncbi:MAG: helix-turn-helix domain-containing protein [Hyphomonas oceanitis]|uniref:MerR family transcriptional regulator n=1 Tax=Hyphomonas oceanitis TaxID=81033 RepID=UPI003001ACD2
MATQRRTIGQLSKTAGVKVTTIRYYESIGLLPDPGRTTGGQRVYDTATQQRLSFIRQSRDLGFPVEAIRELIALQMTPDEDCAKVDKVARHHLAEVDRRLKQLRALKRELQGMITSCEGGEVACCAIMESISSTASYPL